MIKYVLRVLLNYCTVLVPRGGRKKILGVQVVNITNSMQNEGSEHANRA
jgi:hypothetical protein